MTSVARRQELAEFATCRVKVTHACEAQLACTDGVPVSLVARFIPNCT